MLTKVDIERRLHAVNKKFEGKEIIKEKTKMLFKNIEYYSMVELSNHLSSEGIIIDRHVISSLIIQYKKKGCSFFKVNSSSGEEYVYFADYFQKYLDGQLIEEEPIEKSVEELEDYYSSVFDIEIGDAKVVDILPSRQKIFYGFDGQYFKSKYNINNNLCYDDILTKQDAIRFINDKNYKYLWETTSEAIFRSSKQYYYQKNMTIFRNVNDYVSKYIKEFSKDEVLINLGIMW